MDYCPSVKNWEWETYDSDLQTGTSCLLAGSRYNNAISFAELTIWVEVIW